MPNYIKPTITVAANKNTATNNPGPLSVGLSLSTADLLTVDNVQSEIVSITNGGEKILLDGNKLAGTDLEVGGTIGGYVYFSNISAASTAAPILTRKETIAACPPSLATISAVEPSVGLAVFTSTGSTSRLTRATTPFMLPFRAATNRACGSDIRQRGGGL